MVNIDTKYVKSRHLGKARQKPVWHPFSAETFGKSILRSEVFGAVGHKGLFSHVFRGLRKYGGVLHQEITIM